ncbi:MAG: hypothetical protein IMX05_08785 [Hydrogenibacillus schlegelii]|nr:hypothetical protein [Hydrogenibacillus schlegelii]
MPRTDLPPAPKVRPRPSAESEPPLPATLAFSVFLGTLIVLGWGAAFWLFLLRS